VPESRTELADHSQRQCPPYSWEEILQGRRHFSKHPTDYDAGFGVPAAHGFKIQRPLLLDGSKAKINRVLSRNT